MKSLDTQDSFRILQEKIETITQRLQLSFKPPYRRIENLNVDRRATLLLGPRGVGKTTYLVNRAQSLNAFYVSLDNPLIAGVSFYEFMSSVLQSGYDGVICDEVHYLKNWSTILKALYDSFPDKKFIATDSSSLILKKGLGDLSRRFVVETMGYLSFSEYLTLKYNCSLPLITYQQLVEPQLPKLCMQIRDQCDGFHLQKEFQIYLKEGLRPLFLEGAYSQKLMNVVDKIIHSDIPYFLPEIKERHLQLMRHVLGFLAQSPIPTLNVDSLSKEWSVSKTTVYNLLEIMKEVGVLNIIHKSKKVSRKSKGEKIFFSDPSLYSVLSGNLGNIRESYFVMVMKSLNKTILASKNEELGDFSVDEHSFEISGANKKRKKSDFVVKDHLDLPGRSEIPLWVLGFVSV